MLAGRHLHDVVIARKRRRGAQDPRAVLGCSGCAGRVERTNSWLPNHGQLRRNTDRLAPHRLAKLALAIVLIITAKRIGWHDRWNRP